MRIHPVFRILLGMGVIGVVLLSAGLGLRFSARAYYTVAEDSYDCIIGEQVPSPVLFVQAYAVLCNGTISGTMITGQTPATGSSAQLAYRPGIECTLCVCPASMPHYWVAADRCFVSGTGELINNASIALFIPSAILLGITVCGWIRVQCFLCTRDTKPNVYGSAGEPIPVVVVEVQPPV